MVKRWYSWQGYLQNSRDILLLMCWIQRQHITKILQNNHTQKDPTSCMKYIRINHQYFANTMMNKKVVLEHISTGVGFLWRTKSDMYI